MKQYKDHILVASILFLVGFIVFDKYFSEEKNTKKDTKTTQQVVGQTLNPTADVVPTGLIEEKAKKLIGQHLSQLASNDFIGDLTIDEMEEEEGIYTVSGKFVFNGTFKNVKRPYTAKIKRKEKNGKITFEVIKVCYYINYQIDWALRCTDASETIDPLPNKK